MDGPVDRNERQVDPKAEELTSRRDFLAGLGKWSKIVIGTVLFGAAAASSKDAEARWLNRPGGTWRNRPGGGGWINRAGGGGWINRPSGWINRAGGWINRPGGGGWINRPGNLPDWLNRR